MQLFSIGYIAVALVVGFVAFFHPVFRATDLSPTEKVGQLFPFEPMHPASTVEEVRASKLAAGEFIKKYVMLSKPVVIKGGLKEWPALKRWANDTYLTSKLGDQMVKVEHSVDKIFRYYNASFNKAMPFSRFARLLQAQQSRTSAMKRNTRPQASFAPPSKVDFMEATSSVGQDRNYYITGVPVMRGIESDYWQPSFAKLLTLDQEGFWMGHGGQCTPLHLDEMENIVAIVEGSKTFTLIDPTQTKLVYPVYSSGLYSSAIVDVNNLSVTSSWPLFKCTKRLSITLNKGDMLFVPAFWWHQVDSSDSKNIAINFFFQPHSFLMYKHYCGTREKLPKSPFEYYNDGKHGKFSRGI